MSVTKRKGHKSAKAGAHPARPSMMRLLSGAGAATLAPHGADIALAPGIYSDVVSRKAAARGLLNGFGKAVHEAKRSGRRMRMTVLVDPDRVSPEIAVEEVRERPADDLATALAEARARGSRRAAEILNAADMLTADQFAAAIGATRETVHQKRRRHEVLGLEGAKRGVRFPDWQVTADGDLLPGLPRLFEALGGHNWSVYRFLLHRHAELGGATALDGLRKGRVDAVIAAAQNVGAVAFA